VIHLTRTALRKGLERLLHTHDTPRRTAAAYAAGVFWGYSPLLGLHTILGLVTGFAFDLNRVAVLLGVYSNLPWIIGPYYAFVTMVVGAPLTRHKIPPGFKSQVAALFDLSVLHAEFWHQLVRIVKPWFWPYAVGSIIGAIVLAACAYPLALAFVTSRRRIHDIMHHHR
jgi:uncharacterized protein (DUF2062 family)